MDVFEAMGTAMSMRWLKSDPVPDDVIDRLLWAATRASSPSNVQPWEFVVVRDPALRQKVGDAISEGLAGLRARLDEELPTAPVERRMMSGVRHLAANLGQAPVIVFICGRNAYPPGAPQERMMYSAVFGAAQNLMVAARALELGAAYTTFHQSSEESLRQLLGLPDDVVICVTIPVGWPERRFGALSRKPLEEVVHWDRW